jgi:hypothetical protein
MTTIQCAESHAARFFVTGGTVDIVGPSGKVKDTRRVLLSVWRSDGTAIVYVED